MAAASLNAALGWAYAASGFSQNRWAMVRVAMVVCGDRARDADPQRSFQARLVNGRLEAQHVAMNVRRHVPTSVARRNIDRQLPWQRICVGKAHMTGQQCA